MPVLNFNPQPLHIVGVIPGSHVRFNADFTGQDISGNTYAPTVTSKEGVEYVGTATIGGTIVTVTWTDVQTEAIGPGKHSWLFWQTKGGLKSSVAGGNFEVTDGCP